MKIFEETLQTQKDRIAFHKQLIKELEQNIKHLEGLKRVINVTKDYDQYFSMKIEKDYHSDKLICVVDFDKGYRLVTQEDQDNFEQYVKSFCDIHRFDYFFWKKRQTHKV